MEQKFLIKDGYPLLTLFFSGWGGEECLFAGYRPSGSDFLLCCDYRNLDFDPSLLEGYRGIKVVAWSLGVWVAGHVLQGKEAGFTEMIAVNGTPVPVDDRYGIPVKGYILTERGMDERGREKFFRRMLTSNDREWFSGKMPERPLAEQVEELHCIREQAVRMHGEIGWDRVFVSTGDVIFPPENQRNWWGERCRKVISLEGGHYPFRELDNWDLILHDDF